MTRRVVLALLTIAATVGVVAGGAPQAGAASLTQVTSFGTNPGALGMWRYVPDGLPTGRPLVVALHGCTQSASSYDVETGWVKFAEEWDFALVLPEQSTANNGSRCFNWFQPGDYSRGQGEALSIKQMVDKMKTDFGSDASRVFVTGLSAGGAMTTAMLGAYPDVFAGGAVMAGLPYKCASTSSEGFNCMSPGKNLTPQQWGDLVRGASSHTGPWPKVSVWHGTQDFTVATMNMTEIMEQWTNVHGIDQTVDTSDTVAGYPHKVYRDAGGTARVETYSLTGMGHGTAVDPGTGATQCGTAGAYILDVNICSTYYSATFFGLNAGGGGGTTTTTAPTTTTTAPTTTTTTGGGSTTVTFDSVESNDGYVKATSTGGSASVGTLTNLAIGRGTDGLFNRSVASFNTSSIPDGATILRAYVTVNWSSASGDPWANPAGNTLVVDVKNGCFGVCTMEATDWASAPTASAVATIAKFTSGAKSSSDFASGGLSSISKTGNTQLKLRFSQNPTSTAYVFVKSGALADLTIVYQ